MKAPKQPKVDIPKQNSKLGVKKLTKRTTAEPPCTTNISSNGGSLVQNEHSHLVQTKCPTEGSIYKSKTNGGSAAKIVSSFMVPSSVKIKLQLFPADEHTRTGLEKDGFCPYLELTLSPRKKISSVLKHIITKWDRSSVAVGEPKLLSCSVDNVHLTSQRVWTLDDSTTCAIDVFEALGRPSIFRLWYCWFHNPHPYLFASASTAVSGYTYHEARENCTDYENKNVKQHESTTNNGFHLANASHVAVLSEDNCFGGSNYHDEDVKADCNSEKNMLSWYDSCTNISIGGLFSEASLQGKLNTESKPDVSMSKPRQDTSGMNIFDASNVHHITSILDAEDTCSSFSFRKLLSSGNDSPLMDGIMSSKSHASSSSQVVASQVGSGGQEAKTDLLLGSELYNDDRSLGLRSIKWTDSLGPFDLFVPSSQSARNGGT